MLKLEHRADFTGSGWTTNPTAHKYEDSGKRQAMIKHVREMKINV